MEKGWNGCWASEKRTHFELVWSVCALEETPARLGGCLVVRVKLASYWTCLEVVERRKGDDARHGGQMKRRGQVNLRGNKTAHCLTSTTSTTARLMSSALAKYEDFLVRNVSTISSVESSLRSITWFLPGRFKDAELASEACSSYCSNAQELSSNMCPYSVCPAQCYQSISRHLTCEDRAERPQVETHSSSPPPYQIHPCMVRQGQGVQMGSKGARAHSLYSTPC